MPVGRVRVAHYWVDRPYNVYPLLVDGRTLAYYCNVVADTTIADDAVAYDDLVVDVVLRTSGAATVLDEDELPDDLAPRHRLALATALEALITDPRQLNREVERETAPALRARELPTSAPRPPA